MDNKICWGIFMGGLAVGAGIVALFWWGASGAHEKELAITLPNGGSMTLKAQENRIGHKELLDQMNCDPNAGPVLKDWMRGREFFHVTDSNLPDALKNLCAPFPGTFDPVESLDEWSEAARLCAEKEVAKRLREMRDRRDVPFHDWGKPVEVSFPVEPPPLGQAFTCEKDWDLRGRDLRVRNTDNNKSVDVRAVAGTYRCTPGDGRPDIQLNREDARRIFGSSLPPRHKALAIILN